MTISYQLGVLHILRAFKDTNHLGPVHTFARVLLKDYREKLK
jgi:hypothetical protein